MSNSVHYFDKLPVIGYEGLWITSKLVESTVLWRTECDCGYADAWADKFACASDHAEQHWLDAHMA